VHNGGNATGQDLVIVAPALASMVVTPVQAATDAELVALWLHGRGPDTNRAYAADAAAFLAHTGKTLGAVTLGDVQSFVDTLAALAPSSRAGKISAVKSLLSFAHRAGTIVFNVGERRSGGRRSRSRSPRESWARLTCCG
jgi:hypothetical protein